MSDFEPHGYETLREFVSSSDGWRYLAIVDDAGNLEAVIDVPNDSRASWGAATDNPVVLQADIVGGDSDISTPVEIQGTALYDVEPTVGAALTNTNPTHEDNFEEANVIIDENDKVNIDHHIELPEVV